jgi:hypothetical protein
MSDFYQYVRGFFVSITLSTTLERIADGFVMKQKFSSAFVKILHYKFFNAKLNTNLR